MTVSCKGFNATTTLELDIAIDITPKPPRAKADEVWEAVKQDAEFNIDNCLFEPVERQVKVGRITYTYTLSLNEKYDASSDIGDEIE